MATPINPFHELTCQSNIHAKLDCRALLKQRPSDLKYHQTFELFVMAVGHKHITLLPQKEIFYPRDHLSICTKSMGVLIATFLQRKVAFSEICCWTGFSFDFVDLEVHREYRIMIECYTINDFKIFIWIWSICRLIFQSGYPSIFLKIWWYNVEKSFYSNPLLNYNAAKFLKKGWKCLCYCKD